MNSWPRGILFLLGTSSLLAKTTTVNGVGLAPNWILATLLAVVLQRNALNTSRGPYSTAAPLVLACLWAPGGGSWACLNAALCCKLLARSGWIESLWVCLAVAGTVCWLPAAPLTYLGCAAFHAALEWIQFGSGPDQDTRDLSPYLLAKAAGIALAGLLMPFSGSVALLGALLWAAQQGASNAHHRLKSEQLEIASQRLREAQSGLKSVSGEVVAQRERLQILEQQHQILEGLSQHLAESPDLEQTFTAVLATLKRLIRYRSVVVFGGFQGQLWPYRWHSPESCQLEGAHLTGLRDPLVDESWAECEPRSREQAPPSPGLFEGEPCAIALPLPGFGVLYLGRGSGRFEDNEIQQLCWVVRQAALAINASARQEEENRSLQQQALQIFQLRERLALLERLVETFSCLGRSLNLAELLDGLPAEVPKLLPHSVGWCFLDASGDGPSRSWNAAGEAVALRLATACAQQGTPVLIQDIRRTRFDGDAQGILSWIAAPLAGGSSAPGCLVLGAGTAYAYGRDHLNLLTLFCLQLSLGLHNSRLFEEVKESKRRLEQSQAQLIQSSKLSAVGQLAAGVAHELNSPLAAAQISLQSAQMRHPQEDDLNLALSALERAQKIVHRLLTFSRQEIQEGLRPVLVREVAEAALQLARIRRNPGELKFLVTGDQELRALARPLELQQVLLNLLNNAQDACAGLPHPGRIEVRWRQVEQEIHLEVEDNGSGISPEIRATLFQPFATTKSPERGTGLGLSISREIVEEFGGRVECSGSSSQGTTFSVWLTAVEPV